MPFSSGCGVMGDRQDTPWCFIWFLPRAKKMPVGREVAFLLRYDSNWGRHKSCRSFMFCKQHDRYYRYWIFYYWKIVRHSDRLQSYFTIVNWQLGGGPVVEVCSCLCYCNLSPVATPYICKTDVLVSFICYYSWTTLHLSNTVNHDTDFLQLLLFYSGHGFLESPS